MLRLRMSNLSSVSQNLNKTRVAHCSLDAVGQSLGCQHERVMGKFTNSIHLSKSSFAAATLFSFCAC